MHEHIDAQPGQYRASHDPCHIVYLHARQQLFTEAERILSAPRLMIQYIGMGMRLQEEGLISDLHLLLRGD